MNRKLPGWLAQLILRSPFGPRKRWLVHYTHFYPIIRNAFPQNPSGLLHMLLLMDALDGSNTRLRFKRLETLRQICQNGTDAEQALYCVLAGIFHEKNGSSQDMARCMRWAKRFGHDFHLPHAMLCTHYIFNRNRYLQAVEEAEQAIDCTYKYPPLTEEKQIFIAAMYADISLAMSMMHRPDDAAAMLQKAEPAKHCCEYQHAAAILHAVQGNRAEAERFLAQLKSSPPARHNHASANIPLILDGTHPHFTASLPDPEAIRTYWERFRKEESTLMRLMDTGSQNDSFQLHHTFFTPLDSAPPEIDRILLGFKRLEDGTPDFRLAACHSRTYAALITAMIEVCPEDIKARWHFSLED